MAYFCAAELLANVAKHSGASRATISVTDQADQLLMTVTDNGAGGAQLAPGGGLAGLLARVQTVDGRLDVRSPAAVHRRHDRAAEARLMPRRAAHRDRGRRRDHAGWAHPDPDPPGP